jgi:hypothetical protein
LILGFLSLAHFASHDDLQLLPFSCNSHHFLFLHNTPVCVCSTFSFLFFSRWVPRLITQFSYYEQCCYEYWCADIFIVCMTTYIPLDICQECITGSYGFLRPLPCWLPHQFFWGTSILISTVDILIYIPLK